MIPANPHLPRSPRAARLRQLGLAVLLAALGTALPGCTRTSANAPAPGPETNAPTVAVAPVVRADLWIPVTIPAEFHPFAEVTLHAKVSGYLDQLNVDIGDRVKAGQLLATLEVPELKAELDRAMAALDHAGADATNALRAYTRLAAVNRRQSNLVAQQDLDTAEARSLTAAAALNGARAEVERLRTLSGYTRLTAPFDGVITARFADPGALIQSGSGSDTQTRPVVRVSDNFRLRLDFPVPAAYVRDVHVRDPVEVQVQSLGGKLFNGRIARCAGRIEPETRTMSAEAEVANPGLEITPGMYARVELKVQRRPGVLAVPIEAAVRAERPDQAAVLLVNPTHVVEERRVTLGLETPSRCEVMAGLHEGDLVIVGNRSRVHPGQPVAPRPVPSPAPAAP